ncbi:23576_t:CDS:2 [Cetraspora pellucida]|uniref:23576_t:CDS:1 n=1 Tax=Cetraspora pellucida TaxID=1433469 RepID=A0A9N9BL00_9GLOM|nr:23576_t:CDS:2 [Cetraspora pellucida]
MADEWVTVLKIWAGSNCLEKGELMINCLKKASWIVNCLENARWVNNCLEKRLSE